MSEPDDGYKPCSHRFTRAESGRIECQGCGWVWQNDNPKCLRTGVHHLNQKTWTCDECGRDIDTLKDLADAEGP